MTRWVPAGAGKRHEPQYHVHGQSVLPPVPRGPYAVTFMPVTVVRRTGLRSPSGKEVARLVRIWMPVWSPVRGDTRRETETD